MILLRICSSRSMYQLHRVVLRVTVSHYIHMHACSNECLVPILCVCVCVCVCMHALAMQASTRALLPGQGRKDQCDA